MSIGGIWRGRGSVGHHRGHSRCQRKALLGTARRFVATAHVVQNVRQASVLGGRCVGIDGDEDESRVQIHTGLSIVNGKRR